MQPLNGSPATPAGAVPTIRCVHRWRGTGPLVSGLIQAMNIWLDGGEPSRATFPGRMDAPGSPTLGYAAPGVGKATFPGRMDAPG